MKTLLILAMALMVGLAIATVRTSDAQLLAVAGCCKENSGGDWFNIHRNFDQCVEQNSADGDEIFSKSGIYWWDSRC